MTEATPTFSDEPGLPGASFPRLIGLKGGERGEGWSRNTLEVTEEHKNGTGVVHGGVMYAMADTGMAAAMFTQLGPGEGCATIEVSMRYIAPVRSGTLVCETRIVNKGRRVATLESEVRNRDGDGRERLVAKALGSFAVLEPREPAQER